MKKMLFLLLIMLALPFALADVSVKHSAEAAYEGSPIYVHVSVFVDSETKGFDLGEFIPVGWTVDGWDVMGYDEENVKFESENGGFLGKNYSINHWTFSDLTKDIAVSYKISPKDAGDYDFVSVWFYPTGFSMDNMTVSVNPAKQNAITGYVVAEPERTGGNVKTTVTVKQSISDVLENINAISLY